MDGVGESASSAWFGTDYAPLHPRVQTLHLQDGVLGGQSRFFRAGLAVVAHLRFATAGYWAP